jgi:hypothetical protein
VTSVTLLDNDGGKAVAGFAGSDGMFFDPQDKQRLFMVNVFSSAGAIYTADFSNDYSIATLTIRDAFASAYNRPTASTMANGMLWTMNSQLDHIIDDENGALGTPPDLPFQMVGVPLAELFLADEQMTTTTAPTTPPTMMPTTTKSMATRSMVISTVLPGAVIIAALVAF